MYGYGFLTKQTPSNKVLWWALFCFIHPIFGFLVLVTFGDEVTKILKYYVIFVYIYKARWARWKRREENRATKVTKISKTKRPKYGMNKTFIKQNMRFGVVLAG